MVKSKKDKENPRLNFLSNILITIGLICLTFTIALVYQRYNPQKLAFKTTQIEYSNKNSEVYPVAIKIDSANINLPILPARIQNGKWEASTKAVSFLKTSVIPGEKGNSILYGHNWQSLLGNLDKVKTGDKITIIYSDNSTKNFQVEYKTRVKPDNISILNNSSDKRITIYTCIGFLDSERLVLVANLIEA